MRMKSGKLIGFVTTMSVCFVLGRLSSPGPAVNTAPYLLSAKDYELNEVGSYKFISPLLECENFSPGGFQKANQAEDSVTSLVNAAKMRGDISMASVYFRDLNNGAWFGVNEKEPFFPASLLKVPLMMTYLRGAETEPAILDKRIVYDGTEFPVTQNYVYAEPLSDGKSYSVRQLLERMMLTSDNTAMGLLTSEELVSLEDMEKVYAEIGIDSPVQEGYRISPVTYASFFRVLYNSTYLNRKFSEYALELMSHSEFNDGLRAGVPPG